MKKYGVRTALEIESFSLNMGDYLVVNGPSGSGKTTLLRVLGGATALTRGRIFKSPYHGQMRTAYVPQSGGLNLVLSLAKNIVLWRVLYGFSRVFDERSVSFIEKLGLSTSLNMKVGELSSGYQKLALLACALSVRPHGLLIDEPFSGLDQEKAEIVQDILLGLESNLRYLVVATHTSTDLPTFTRTVELRAGRIL